MNDKTQADVPACCQQCIHYLADGCDFGLMLPRKKQQCKRMEAANVQTKGLTGMIQMIEISRIRPHKDNPRKDLGDLTELAESIKSTGILQNLTVVPWLNDEFVAVIGHRRLAAAKLAGLTEVPCVISNMDYKDQIATMLLENMQRNDLTICEQAEGFQMMLDLGESVNDISHKTGLSDTTVRRRVKLLELDKAELKKSVERGGTLMDFAELEKIEDVHIRNSVLSHIGTSNFSWKLREALELQKCKKNNGLILEKLKDFAAPTTEKEAATFKFVDYYNSIVTADVPTPTDLNNYDYFYIDFGRHISLYKKNKNAKADVVMANADTNAPAKETISSNTKNREELNEITTRAYRLRYDFVKKITNAAIKKNINEVIRFYLKMVFENIDTTPDLEDIINFFDIKTNKETDSDLPCSDVDDEDFDLSYNDMKDKIAEQPEKYFLACVYLSCDDSYEKYYNTWSTCCFKENKILDAAYKLLISFGYEMSDEEIALANGSHELFVKPSEQ